MQSVLSFKKDELLSFGTLLQKNHRGGMQYRNGYKTHVETFCVVKVVNQVPLKIDGHLCGPHGNNATFSVSMNDSGQSYIQLKGEAPTGFDIDRAYKEIVSSLSVMMTRVRYEKKTGKMSTANWEGYYLRSTGGKKVGKTGENNFDDAIKIALVSLPFKRTCLNFGFTMLKCGQT